MKRITLLFLLLLLPVAAQAQDPSAERSKAKKLEWIGIGLLAGGIGSAVFGMTRTETAVASSQCIYVQAGPPTGTPPVGCIAVTGINISQSSVTTTTVATFLTQVRATNWKIAGPAIAGAGAGALLITLGRSRAKSAQISIQPDGGMKVAFRW